MAPNTTKSSTDLEFHATGEAPVVSGGRGVGTEDDPVSPSRFWILSVGLNLGLFLSILDSSIVATSLYTIGVEFNSLDSINWVALSYTLGYLSCAVLLARVSDIVGRKYCFLASFVIFVVFSLGCGFSRNTTQLIACRAAQGLGGSGLSAISMIIMLEVCPNHMRQYISSLAGFVISSAGVVGPVLGGVLTHYATWRWVFWINAPIGITAMLVFFLAWPETEPMHKKHRRSWKELDYVGSFLLLCAAVLVVFSFQNIGSDTNRWSQAIFIAPITVGVFCWIALFAWEAIVYRYWRDRIAGAFPLGLFCNRFYTAAALATLFLGFPYLLLVFSFPIRLQVVNGKSSLMAGVLLLPMLGSAGVGSAVSGWLSTKKNYTSEILIASACLMLLGCGLMTTLSHSVDLEAKALGFLVFSGLGFGFSATGAAMIAGTESPLRDHAPAQGIVSQLRILGGSIGIASSTAILGLKIQDQVAGLLTPEQIESLRGGSMDLSGPQLEAVRNAYANAFTEDMKVATAVSAVAVLITLLAFRRKTPILMEQRKQQLDEHIKWLTAKTRPVVAKSDA